MVSLSLVNQDNYQIIKQWHFYHHKIIRIGRVSDNDVVLADFPQISRYHLELTKIDSRNNWEAVNIGINKSFLNGIEFQKTLLPNNALISICQQGALLKFSLSSKLDYNLLINQSLCDHQGNNSQNIFCIHCGQPLVAEKKLIGNYQIIKIIGKGGMGTTYLVADKNQLLIPDSNPQLLVLKELNNDLVKLNKAQELFMREAKILNLLNHPNIPKYHDFFTENNYSYLVMELIHGKNLQQLIYQQGIVSELQAIKWLLQVSQIVSYLHSFSPPLIHRDIKPNNLILRAKDQQIFLLDFGAVKEIGTPAGTCIGAEGFAPPEQIIGQPCPQSDLYAMGATLIFLLTGKNPLNYLQIKQKSCAFNLDKISHLSPKILRFIRRACQVKISDRYQNINDFQKNLQQLKDEL